MGKKFVKPEMKIITFDVNDIIVASGGPLEIGDEED